MGMPAMNAAAADQTTWFVSHHWTGFHAFSLAQPQPARRRQLRYVCRCSGQRHYVRANGCVFFFFFWESTVVFFFSFFKKGESMVVSSVVTAYLTLFFANKPIWHSDYVHQVDVEYKNSLENYCSRDDFHRPIVTATYTRKRIWFVSTPFFSRPLSLCDYVEMWNQFIIFSLVVA